MGRTLRRRDPVRIRLGLGSERLHRHVLDLIHLALTVALFTLVALIAKGVERA